MSLARLVSRLAAAAASLAVASACAAPASDTPPAPAATPAVGTMYATRWTLEAQASGTTALLQAVSPVSERVVWVSGHAGTYARTLDGGATWTAGRVAGADSLQFRDVHAAGADTAWLMSAGTGPLSRIYRTTDGGATWTLQYTAPEPEAFLDCLAFWDSRRGIAFGDALDGAHYVLLTTDGGDRWARVPADRLPAAAPGEGSFAASGTCVATAGSERAWIGTGNASPARVLRTDDGGRSWRSATVPVASGEAAGLASVAFRDSLHGAALGGEIGKAGARGDYVALTDDGGATWRAGGRPRLAGAVYGAAWVPGAASPTLLAVGPGGADISRDGGRSWRALDSLAYWSVGVASPRAGWLVGPGGRIVKVTGF